MFKSIDWRGLPVKRQEPFGFEQGAVSGPAGFGKFFDERGEGMRFVAGVCVLEGGGSDASQKEF
jgi:hypothetical protein